MRVSSVRTEGVFDQGRLLLTQQEMENWGGVVVVVVMVMEGSIVWRTERKRGRRRKRLKWEDVVYGRRQ